MADPVADDLPARTIDHAEVLRHLVDNGAVADWVKPVLREAAAAIDSERACHVEATAQWLAAEARVSVLTTALGWYANTTYHSSWRDDDWYRRRAVDALAAVPPTPEPPEVES